MVYVVNTAAARILALRAWMKNHDLDAVIVTTADPHLSEYLPEHWAFRHYLSGFSGSAGLLAITHEHAALWTDSRYWVQAQAELTGSDIVLMRAGASGVPAVSRWLADALPRGAKLGIDGRTLSHTVEQQWLPDWDAAGITVQTQIDPASAIWQNRPALPRQPVYAHAIPYACRHVQDNLHAVRTAMREHHAQWHWLSSLDDIAWLFNLRGSDIAHNPVFLSYALIGLQTAQLFIQADVLDAHAAHALTQDGIVIEDYAQASAALQDLPNEQTILSDPARTTVHALAHMQHLRTVLAINPSQRLKSCKNAQELAHIRQTMVQDGVALCEFFAWLEAALARGEPLNEVDVDTHLTAARARQPHFICPSFPTIAAFNANAAMPHYRADAKTCSVIQGDGLLLIDSGGQYLGGTTDITRMVAIGQPSAAQRHDCTVVLQGMIALSQAVFPHGISAGALDAIARAPIWRAGADYGHGTGHGVGYFLNVHEGPQSITHHAANRPYTEMLPGMVTSNEPGLYRMGHWGVRIENLLANVVSQQSDTFGDFLAFETLTLCPIDTRCFDLARLNARERDWLNTYHAHVRTHLLPHTQGAARDWLQARTQTI